MYNILGIYLNGRELAIIVQFLIVFIFVMSIPDVRLSFKNVIQTMLAPNLLSIFILLVSSAVITIASMSYIKIWTDDMIPQAVEIVFTVALLRSFSIIGRQDPTGSFVENLKETFSTSMVVTAFATITSFSFLCEFTALSIIAVLSIAAATEQVNEGPLNKISQTSTLLYGFLTLANAILSFFNMDITTNLINVSKSIVFTVLFSVMLMPIQYLFAYWSLLESTLLHARYYNDAIPVWKTGIWIIFATKFSLSKMNILQKNPLFRKQLSSCKKYRECKQIIELSFT